MTLNAGPFETTYARVVKMMSDLGGHAEGASVGTSTLDRALAEAAATAATAAQSLGVTTRAEISQASAAMKAADAESVRAAKTVVASDALLREVAATERQAASTAKSAASTSEAALAESRLTQATLRQQAAQDRLTALEASGTASARQLASAETALIAANDRVTLANERVAKSTGTTSAAAQGAGRGMVVVGALIAAGLTVAGKAAADFDAKMALVQTLAKASPAEFAQLRAAAVTVGQAYGYTATQVADAEAELVKAGLSVKDIVGGALVGALTLAAAGQENVANATNTAAVAMTQFKLSGRDVPHIADLLAGGADKALGSVADLSEALSYGGVAAHQAGMSIETTIGILAELAQSGQLGSIAGTQLAQMLRNLEAPTDKARTEMQNLGLQVYGASGRMLPMATIAQELHDKIGKLPPAQRDAALAALFTARSVRAATILMQGGGQAVVDWTEKVNDSGFAALQASGKLNSLSGDVTKLRAALQTAFIGTGQDAQGPLRTVVRDVTAVVEAWNHLPGPVRSGTEVLLIAGGAVTLLGGAALLFIPKWQAMNAALADTQIGAITAGRALSGLAKGGLVVGTIVGIAEAASALGHVLAHDTDPSVAQFTLMLTNLAHAAPDALGGLTGFATAISMGVKSGTGIASDMVKNLDGALAGMVTSGHADQAATAWTRLSEALHKQGLSTASIINLFPQYAGALDQSAASAKLSATGIDQYGNAVSASAKATKTAIDAAKDYSDALHALADPLFAENKALVDLQDKRSAEAAALAAAAAAVKKYGANSKEARAAAAAAKQAHLDVASSALDVAVASRNLSASVKDGTTSLAAARRTLQQWVAAGILTKAEASAVAISFGMVIDKAQHINGAIDQSARHIKASAPQFRAAGNAVVGGLQTALNALPADLAKQEAAMRRAGSIVGTALTDGMSVAVAHGAGHVELVSARMVKGVLEVMRNAAEAKSPSRATARLGGDLADGLPVGYLAKQPQVLAAFRQGTAATLYAVEQAVRQMLSRANSRLSSDVQARASAAQSITSGITGNFALSGAFGPNNNVGNLSAYFGNGGSMLARELTLLTRLKGKHLAPGLLAEIAQLAPAQAIAAETSILSGKSGSIATLDRQYAQIARYAGQIGNTVASAQFDQMIAHDKAALIAAQETNQILRELVTEYKKQPKALAAALDSAIRTGQAHR